VRGIVIMVTGAVRTANTHYGPGDISGTSTVAGLIPPVSWIPGAAAMLVHVDRVTCIVHGDGR
jgi:hypothetical protein